MYLEFKSPNKKSVWNIANKVFLKQGGNTVPNAAWNAVKHIAVVQQRIDKGLLTVSESEIVCLQDRIAVLKEEEAGSTDTGATHVVEEAKERPASAPKKRSNRLSK